MSKPKVKYISKYNFADLEPVTRGIFKLRAKKLFSQGFRQNFKAYFSDSSVNLSFPQFMVIALQFEGIKWQKQDDVDDFED